MSPSITPAVVHAAVSVQLVYDSASPPVALKGVLSDATVIAI
jgi:hypothetical protein